MVNLPPEVSPGASDYFYFSHLAALPRPLVLARIFFSVPPQSASAGAGGGGPARLIVGFWLLLSGGGEDGSRYPSVICSPHTSTHV